MITEFICIQGDSVFCEALFKKEIITLEDLTTEENGAITGFQIMASASFSPKDKFQLMAIMDAIPTHHLKTCQKNRPFPSSPPPPFQSEAKCEVFVIKISFHSY